MKCDLECPHCDKLKEEQSTYIPISEPSHDWYWNNDYGDFDDDRYDHYDNYYEDSDESYYDSDRYYHDTD